MQPPDSAAYEALKEDLDKVRHWGAGRLRELDLPALTAVSVRNDEAQDVVGSITSTLKRAAEDLGGSEAVAALISLGLAPGTRGLNTTRRRERAAQVFGLQPESFRKKPEARLMALLAESLLTLDHGLSRGEGEPLLESTPATRSLPGNANAFTGTAETLIQARDINITLAMPALIQTISDQLPTPIPNFINRQEEFASVANHPPRQEHILLTGPPGSGKSEFALQVAHEHALTQWHRLYYDGNLDLASGVFEIVADLLEGLGIPPALIPTSCNGVLATISNIARDNPVLMLLDNIPANLDLSPLLRLPNLHAIITSDMPMILPALAGRIHPIQMRGLKTEWIPPFIRSRYPNSPELTAQLIAAIEEASEGLPSAILSIAARIQTESYSIGMSPELMREEFEDVADAIMIDPYHATLAQLSANETVVLRRLAAIPVSIPVQACARLVDGDMHPNRIVSKLIQSGIVRISPADGHCLLDKSMRRFLSKHRPIPPEEAAESIRRITTWYTEVVSQVKQEVSWTDKHDPFSSAGEEPVDTIHAAHDPTKWLASEKGTMSSLVTLAYDNGLFDASIDLALSLWPVFSQTFTFLEWRSTAQTCLAAARAVNNSTRVATALHNLSHYHLRHGEYEDCQRLADRALASAADDSQLMHMIQNTLGLAHIRQRDFDVALEYFGKASMADASDTGWNALVRANRAEALLLKTDLAAAQEILMDMPQLFHNLHDVPSEGNALWLQSQLFRKQGDPECALKAIREALAIARHHQQPVWEGCWLIEEARVLGEYMDAREAVVAALSASDIHSKLGDAARNAEALRLASAFESDRIKAMTLASSAVAQASLSTDRWQLGMALRQKALVCEASDRGESVLLRAQASKLLADFHDREALLIVEELAY